MLKTAVCGLETGINWWLQQRPRPPKSGPEWVLRQTPLGWVTLSVIQRHTKFKKTQYK